MTSLSQWELLPSGSLRTDEDEDEETELEIQDPIITILRSNNNYENVIFVTEGSGQVFIKSVFPELEVIGTLLIPEEPLMSYKLDGSKGCSEAHSTIYSLGSHKTAFVFCSSVSQKRVHQWVKELFKILNIDKQTRVAILDRLSDIQQLTYSISNSLLRRISTSFEDNAQVKVNYLESPIIVDNLSAAIITQSEMYGIKATLYLSSEDSKIVSLDSVLAFAPLLDIYFPLSKLQIDTNKCKLYLSQYNNQKINTLFL